MLSEYKLNNEIKKENYTLSHFTFINLLKPILIIRFTIKNFLLSLTYLRNLDITLWEICTKLKFIPTIRILYIFLPLKPLTENSYDTLSILRNLIILLFIKKD